jgi:hypothetical protein
MLQSFIFYCPTCIVKRLVVYIIWGIEKALKDLIPEGSISRMLRFPGVVVDLSLGPIQTASGVLDFLYHYTL